MRIGLRRIAPAALLLAGLLAAAPATAQEPDRRRGFSVKMVEPIDQDVVFGKTRVSAEVEIDREDHLDRVEFYVNGEVIFVDREAPFQTFWDFGDASKNHVIRVTAFHREGASVTDFVITRKISLAYAVDVNRVVVHATVLDSDDHPVLGLDKDQFAIFEDGVEQKIIDFYIEERPITVAVVLDTSGSMHERMEETQQAAASFVDYLEGEDRALVIDFDEQVYLLQELTDDKEKLKEALLSTYALGGTALYDALHASFRKLNQIDGRKAIVLLSDGDDTESQFELEKVIEAARTSDVIIYPIGLGGAFSGVARGVLKDFARETGGRGFFPSKTEELPAVYAQIAEELRNQYYLTYSSDNETFDGRWIKIKLEARNKALNATTRRGYYAVRD